MALFRITNCTACQCRLKPITSNYRRWWTALPAKGSSSSSSKKRKTRMALISTFSTKATGLRCITTAKAAKRNWCVTSVAFYSSSHDRFTYGSSFINFNLPQFYQIVKVDGREQVIPFRTNLSVTCRLPIRITIRRYYSNIFRDERAGKRGLSGMQS